MHEHNDRLCISIVTLIIAVIIFVQTNFLTIMMLTLKFNERSIISMRQEEKSFSNTKEEWRLVIPKIDISANIKDGTGGDIINDYIGHFENTPYEDGNIGLIAASAGYKENYFTNLKDLERGDVIIYEKGDIKREYEVQTNAVIEQTDWSYLSSTKDNRLTLITGILEEPEKRICVQAIEID